MLDFGRRKEVIEIKLTSGPSPEDLNRLSKISEMIQGTRQLLLCRVAQSVTTGNRWVTRLEDYLTACSP